MIPPVLPGQEATGQRVERKHGNLLSCADGLQIALIFRAIHQAVRGWIVANRAEPCRAGHSSAWLSSAASQFEQPIWRNLARSDHGIERRQGLLQRRLLVRPVRWYRSMQSTWRRRKLSSIACSRCARDSPSPSAPSHIQARTFVATITWSRFSRSFIQRPITCSDTPARFPTPLERIEIHVRSVHVRRVQEVATRFEEGIEQRERILLGHRPAELHGAGRLGETCRPVLPSALRCSKGVTLWIMARSLLLHRGGSCTWSGGRVARRISERNIRHCSPCSVPRWLEGSSRRGVAMDHGGGRFAFRMTYLQSAQAPSPLCHVPPRRCAR